MNDKPSIPIPLKSPTTVMPKCSSYTKKVSSTPPDSDLEDFFNTMGMDAITLASLVQCPGSSVSGSPVSSLCNSVDSRRRGSSESADDGKIHAASSAPTSDHHTNLGLSRNSVKVHAPAETSIIERNARVIKWLLTIKKMDN